MSFRYTREIIEPLVEHANHNPPFFTDESISCINELYELFIEDIVWADNETELEDISVAFSGYISDDANSRTETSNLDTIKFGLLVDILKVLLYGDNENGIAYNASIISPWMIKDHIRHDEYLSNFFNLQIPIEYDFDGIEIPTTIPIEFEINGTRDIYEYVSHKHVLGILAFYNSVLSNDDVPISYCGSCFEHEQNNIKQIANEPQFLSNNDYTVKIGEEYYSCSDLDFLQGAISAAIWNDIDPYECITEFKVMIDGRLHNYEFFS